MGPETQQAIIREGGFEIDFVSDGMTLLGLPVTIDYNLEAGSIRLEVVGKK